MANTRYRFRSETLPIRVESGQLILPETVGSRVENMYLTEEGTLRAVWGPCPLVPAIPGTKSPGTAATAVVQTDAVLQGMSPKATTTATAGNFSEYVTMHGIFHARLGIGGEREVLLIQTGNQVWVFEGWEMSRDVSTFPKRPWRVLLGPAASSPQRTTEINADTRPRFPAQFERTPNGVVIIPRGETARPYFYDGIEVLPLGYASGPGAPVGVGPETNTEDDGTEGESNAYGFSHTGSSTHPHFRKGRLGSVNLASTVGSSAAGKLAKGSWRGAVQWVDRWGNVSPLSGKSSPVVIEASNELNEKNIARGLHHFFWTGIEPGPEGTIGRIFLRTKDELNSGSLDLYEMSAYAAGGFLNFATIPDNVSYSLPDNIPDNWLINKALDVVAVRPFKLYKVAFGRGWAANFDDDPGRIQPTLPGRWGTFPAHQHIYPDPRAAEITGLAPVQAGLLAFTESSTYLITPFDSAEGFRSQTLHPTIGCAAPSSIAGMADGSTVWLGREGFYRFKPDMGIELISAPISYDLRTMNRARLLQSCASVDVRENKYRCWVPMEGSKENNVCWEFDGRGWTRRTDVNAAAVCVTDDHRHYMLTAGRAQQEPVSGTTSSLTDGVWVLDHEVQSWRPVTRSAVVRTAWLRPTRVQAERGSPMTVYLWLRETEAGELSVEVQRDYRPKVIQTATARLHPQDDFPPIWAPLESTQLEFGAKDANQDPITWNRRRPYWTRVDVYLPSSESFRLKITHTGDWEFLGMAIDEVPHPDSMRSAPR